MADEGRYAFSAWLAHRDWFWFCEAGRVKLEGASAGANL
jgi:hypothetical protein